MKIFSQRKQQKCNFCLEWFMKMSDRKSFLNICPDCFDKTYKYHDVQAVMGQYELYQVHLVRKNTLLLPQVSTYQRNLLAKIDQIQNQQINTILSKWTKTSRIIQKLNCLNEVQQQRINKKLEDFRVSSKQNYEKFQYEINNIINNISEQKAQQIVSMTASKEDKQNHFLKIKRTTSQCSFYDANSPELALNLDFSKKRQNKQRPLTSKDNSFMKKSILTQSHQNYETDRACSSIFNLADMKALSRTQSSKKLFLQNENSYFSPAMNQIKNNISNILDSNKHLAPNAQRIMKQKICQAILNTYCFNKCIELVSYSFVELDIFCYLSMLKWQGVQIVKLVKLALNDQQGLQLMHFIMDKPIQTVVLTNNNLTDQFCEKLLQIDLPNLKNIYLGKNQIHAPKIKQTVKQLKQKYTVYL